MSLPLTRRWPYTHNAVPTVFCRGNTCRRAPVGKASQHACVVITHRSLRASYTSASTRVRRFGVEADSSHGAYSLHNVIVTDGPCAAHAPVAPNGAARQPAHTAQPLCAQSVHSCVHVCTLVAGAVSVPVGLMSADGPRSRGTDGRFAATASERGMAPRSTSPLLHSTSPALRSTSPLPRDGRLRGSGFSTSHREDYLRHSNVLGASIPWSQTSTVPFANIRSDFDRFAKLPAVRSNNGFGTASREDFKKTAHSDAPTACPAPMVLPPSTFARAASPPHPCRARAGFGSANREDVFKQANVLGAALPVPTATAGADFYVHLVTDFDSRRRRSPSVLIAGTGPARKPDTAAPSLRRSRLSASTGALPPVARDDVGSVSPVLELQQRSPSPQLEEEAHADSDRVQRRASVAMGHVNVSTRKVSVLEAYWTDKWSSALSQHHEWRERLGLRQ